MQCYYLCLFILISTVKSDDIAIVKNETQTDESNIKSDDVKNNSTIEMQRITQPSAQTQNVERAITPKNSTTDKGNSDFKPSPHLETYYEFNKTPVPPALPEAKHLSHFNFGEYSPWTEKHFPTSEPSWTARVKFPSPTSPPTGGPPVVKERPYQFYNSENSNKGNNVSTGKSYNIPTNKESSLSSNRPSAGDWNQYIGNFEKRKPAVEQKNNHFDFRAPVPVDKFTSGTGTGTGHINQKTHFDYEVAEKPQYGLQGTPWKKIIKFLTAFIPIGLLISALTPTVITVTSVNATQPRSRASNARKETTNKLLSSLSYLSRLNSLGCEDRILCELLLSATSTKNAEEHIENLLNTFTDNGKAVERAEDMKKIFKAVRNQDCQPIACTSLKGNT